MTKKGVKLAEVYVGTEGVLTGSARIAQEELITKRKLIAEHELAKKKRLKKIKIAQLKAQIQTLERTCEGEESSLEILEKEKENFLRLDSASSDRLKSYRS